MTRSTEPAADIDRWPPVLAGCFEALLRGRGDVEPEANTYGLPSPDVRAYSRCTVT